MSEGRPDRSAGQWTALSGATIGSVHVRDGLPMQDAHAIHVQDGTAIISVADGHGHRLHFRSDVGSALAVQIAVELLRAVAPDLTDTETATTRLIEVGRTLVARWQSAVEAHVATHPFVGLELDLVASGADRQQVVRPYGTTILAMVATGDLLGAIQIGDGDSVVVTRSGRALRPLVDDPDLDGVRTTSLCQPDPTESLRVGVIDITQDEIVLGYLCTDGFSTARVDADLWWRQTGEELVGFAREHGFAWIDQRLLGWLEEPAAVGGDDTTMAIVALVELGDLSPAEPPTT